MLLPTVLKREVRVALSRRAQPVWFRMLKWIIALAVSAALWRTRSFWWWIIDDTFLPLFRRDTTWA